jgi:hypothetical protein
MELRHRIRDTQILNDVERFAREGTDETTRRTRVSSGRCRADLRGRVSDEATALVVIASRQSYVAESGEIINDLTQGPAAPRTYSNRET